VHTSVFTKVSKLQSQNRLVIADLGLLNFYNLLRLHNLANTSSLQDEVWKVVPEDTFMDNDLDCSVDVATNGPLVCAVLEVSHSKGMVMVDCCMLLWNDLNVVEPVFDDYSFKSAVKRELVSRNFVWFRWIPHVSNWKLNRAILNEIDLTWVRKCV